MFNLELFIFTLRSEVIKTISYSNFYFFMPIIVTRHLGLICFAKINYFSIFFLKHWAGKIYYNKGNTFYFLKGQEVSSQTDIFSIIFLFHTNKSHFGTYLPPIFTCYRTDSSSQARTSDI